MHRSLWLPGFLDNWHGSLDRLGRWRRSCGNRGCRRWRLCGGDDGLGRARLLIDGGTDTHREGHHKGCHAHDENSRHSATDEERLSLLPACRPGCGLGLPSVEEQGFLVRVDLAVGQDGCGRSRRGMDRHGHGSVVVARICAADCGRLEQRRAWARQRRSAREREFRFVGRADRQGRGSRELFFDHRHAGAGAHDENTLRRSIEMFQTGYRRGQRRERTLIAGVHLLDADDGAVRCFDDRERRGVGIDKN